MVTIMKIGVVVKRGDMLSYRIARELLEYGHKVLNVEMLIDSEISKEINWAYTFSIDIDKVDFLLIVGGDGTLLRTIQRMKYIDTPIVGVKTGRRGFLFDVEPPEALNKLKDLVDGKYTIHEYMRLKILAEKSRDIYYALNDMFVASLRDVKSRIISLEVSIDDETLYRFDGDGVIVSTPLGSTAYAFSAGGPVVDADIEAIIVAPLAPLQANAKPVVLSPTKVIKVVNMSRTDVALCIIDGETRLKLQSGESVVVKKADVGVRFARFKKFKTYRRVQVCEF